MERIDKQRVDGLHKEGWGGFNPETVHSIMDSDTPLVSVVMLSYLRKDKLIGSLKHMTSVFNTPLNMCLRVQESESDEEVLDLLDRFHKYDVMFTPTNIGTGVPRHERLHTALNTFDTPFILFTDDDMRMPRYSIEVLTSILIDNPEFGAVNMFTAPRSNVWRLEKGTNKIVSQRPKEVFEHEDVVSLGSATLVVRREVFDECDLDNEYKVGLADVDFGLQMYEKGWKMGMLNIDGYDAQNLKGGERRYQKSRYRQKWISKSRERFIGKWPKYWPEGK